jgi:alpha-L-rhamnosidase
MAEFTVQINQDVVFNHDEALLAKAEENTPAIHKTPVAPKAIVELVPDATKQNGWGAVAAKTPVELLPEIGLSRGQSLILDFGDHQVGSFSVDIESVGSPMDAPLFLKLSFAEIPAELAADPADYDGWLSKSWIQDEYVHLDVLPAHLELPRRYSCRYVRIEAVDTSLKWTAHFSNPCIMAESAVDMAALQMPELDDPELAAIYRVSAKTLADCMQEVFEDGPKRDRRLWLGDLRLQALANYATFDNVELVKRCLYLFAGMTASDGRISANVFTKPVPVPDDTFLFEYSLFFTSVLHDLDEAHPDLDLVRELYPVCKKQMDYTLGMVDGEGHLITRDDYPVFVDWSNEFNKDTCGQAETIYVLRQFVELARLVGDADADKYAARLDQMVAYARERLFVAERGLFVTSGDEYNIASQVWMVHARVVEGDEARALMERCVAELFPVRGIATPYMYHHVVEALYVAGLADEATRLMKDYWGKMVSLGADTFWEAFDPDKPDFSPYGSPIVNSYCHAWSCTPVYLINKYLL